MMAKFEKSDKDLLKSVESGEWRSVANSARELERYRSYARATFKKDRRVNIGYPARIWKPCKSARYGKGFLTKH